MKGDIISRALSMRRNTYIEIFRGIFYDNDNEIISKATIESFRPIVMYKK